MLPPQANFDGTEREPLDKTQLAKDLLLFCVLFFSAFLILNRLSLFKKIRYCEVLIPQKDRLNSFVEFRIFYEANQSKFDKNVMFKEHDGEPIVIFFDRDRKELERINVSAKKSSEIFRLIASKKFLAKPEKIQQTLTQKSQENKNGEKSSTESKTVDDL